MTSSHSEGKGSTPKVKNFVDASSAVFGPFDCHPADNSTCPDAFGTEDPRLTYDPESETYYLLYNEWSKAGAFVATASTKNPTVRDGWTRHGRTIPEAGGKSGSIVYMKEGPHYVLWGCQRNMRIAPSVGRSLLHWDYNKTQNIFEVRKPPYWDTGGRTRCTLHTALRVMHTAHCTLHTAHCTLRILQIITAHCALRVPHCTPGPLMTC